MLPLDPRKRQPSRRRAPVILRGVIGACGIAVALGGSVSVPALAGEHAQPHLAAALPSCLNADTPGLRERPVRVAHVPGGTPGKVLPGAVLHSQFARRPRMPDPDPLFAHYPPGELRWTPTWRHIAGLAPSSLVYASKATAVFNGDQARYRIAFNSAYFGVDPTNIGDFNGDGIDDLAIPDHYAYVDGHYETGEVDLYVGRRGHQIDPRRDVPDVILYGDQPVGKLGISVAGAGDVNGDGHDDLLIAAAFHDVVLPNGRTAYNAGRVYLVYGGYLNHFRCPVKIRIQDIGRTVPGIVFNGGEHGSLFLGYANELDSGDFNGDGLSDLVIGSYNPYPGTGRAPGARAYLIDGSRHLPRYMPNFTLGVDADRDGIRTTEYTLPSAALTRDSLGFSASFVGDLTGNGHDDLAFTAGLAGHDSDGEAFVFFDPPHGARSVPIERAPLTISADSLSDPPLTFEGIESIRPNGDVYGDGHQDALLTARYTRGLVDGQSEHVGAVGVLQGRARFPRHMTFSQLNTIIYGTEPGEVGQPAMATGADFNGDGCTDILINDASYLESMGGSTQYRGRMWLILGRRDLPHTMPLEASADRTILADTRIPGFFGFNWTTGDFNADGRPDLVVADHYAGDKEHHLFGGRDYLFANSALHLPWHPATSCR